MSDKRGRVDAASGMDDAYRLTLETPAIADYLRLRADAGMTPRSARAAQAGLPHTRIGVVIRRDGQAVGMGRVIGDGLHYLVVDIAVDPAHQGRGLGKAIMAALSTELRRIAPAEAYVCLIADGEAHRLYRRFGFRPTAPASIGMAQWIGN
ncbi:MAG: GNAT family N-acetyltransferase [Sphingopyxis sp.]|uniref:GNAT family N-acetyltransferase n=1 Tax=Sphingopyxis sp. TaxID=1908224 RepID=UPI002AB90F6B|nr:GNAT family N-acetyltransferase [Sphingopyxis sp.]MDZ3831297.1 GNAT family N-acetyltransferase [Sphingopyxis sp.]